MCISLSQNRSSQEAEHSETIIDAADNDASGPTHLVANEEEELRVANETLGLYNRGKADPVWSAAEKDPAVDVYKYRQRAPSF